LDLYEDVIETINSILTITGQKKFKLWENSKPLPLKLKYPGEHLFQPLSGLIYVEKRNQTITIAIRYRDHKKFVDFIIRLRHHDKDGVKNLANLAP